MNYILIALSTLLISQNLCYANLPTIEDSFANNDVYWSVSMFKKGNNPRLEYLLPKDLSDSQWDEKLSINDKIKCKFTKSKKLKPHDEISLRVSGFLNCTTGVSTFRVGPARCKTHLTEKKFTDRDMTLFEYKSTDFEIEFRITCTSVPKPKYRSCSISTQEVGRFSHSKLNRLREDIFENHCELLVREQLKKLKNKNMRVLYLESILNYPDCYQNDCADLKAMSIPDNLMKQSCEKGYPEACYLTNLKNDDDPKLRFAYDQKYCEKDVLSACSGVMIYLKEHGLDDWKHYAKKVCNLGEKLGCQILENDKLINSLNSNNK